jgi:hypothetical protein
VLPNSAYYLSFAPSQVSFVDIVLDQKDYASHKFLSKKESLVFKRNKDCFLTDLFCEKRRDVSGEGRKLLPLLLNR